MFTNIHHPGDILNVIARMRAIATEVGRKGGMKSIVIGMPNTGKSSMLNVIRRHATHRKCPPIFMEYMLIVGKAVRTSSQAGLTRAISGVIKVVDDPLIYMFDSPGPQPHLTQLICRRNDALHPHSGNVFGPCPLRFHPR